MRRMVWVLVTVAAVGGGVLALRAAIAKRSVAAADGEIARVTRRDVGYVVKATGVIKPKTGAEVRVGSQISGVVRRLFVHIGDTVGKGQPLAELDDRDLLARRAEAVAALASARANLAFTGAEARRQRELAAARVVSASALDAAERAQALALAQLQQATAALASAATQLGYARIAAPIAGVVASISTQEGETVAASFATPTFVTLLDLSRLEVRAYVDETDIGRIAVGQPARFTVDTYSDRDFEGHVEAVYPQAEIRDNVVNYVTVVDFDPPHDRVLRPEMTATVRIALETRRGVLALPLRAIHREGDGAYVLRRHGEALERLAVTTGGRDDGYWEITTGLREGDEVVVADASGQKEP